MKLQQAENFPQKISHLVYGTASSVSPFILEGK